VANLTVILNPAKQRRSPVPQPQVRERQLGESPAHIVLGLVAVLVAAVFGGVSYVSGSIEDVQPPTSVARKARRPQVRLPRALRHVIAVTARPRLSRQRAGFLLSVRAPRADVTNTPHGAVQ
jgi:hypothetical protein